MSDYALRRESAADFLIDMAQGQTFSFSRWSDGEWTLLLGRLQPANADGHPYSTSLRMALKDALATPGPRVGMGAIARRLYGYRIDDWLKKNPSPKEFYDADLFHCEQTTAAKAGRVSSLVQFMRTADVRTIVVGPEPYRELDSVFPVSRFVRIPSLDCWANYPEWLEETWDEMRLLRPPVLVSVSASMPAKALIHDLHARAEKEEVKAWLLDLGSIWLSYLDGHGLKTRSYQRGWVPCL